MYQKTVLDNGVRIVTEQLPSRTVSVGIWVDVGGRDENDLNTGTAHFVEHMLFKGTDGRTAQQIGREFDILGGMSNAFTSHEHTCYYVTVMDSHLPRAMDLLADIFLNSVFDEQEVERERQVILQEISMVEDTPDDHVHELFSTMYWGRHPLGNTVLGSREVVGNMDSSRLREYVDNRYRPDRIVISAAGNVNHHDFVALVSARFDRLAAPSADKTGWERVPPDRTIHDQQVVNKPFEQVHVVMGVPGLPLVSEDRYKMALVHVILGGNMSSRLFQEVREKRGLAYSVYSFLSSYKDCGYLGVYAGLGPEAVNEVMDIVRREIANLRTTAVSEEELDNAKEFARGGMYLASENMETRMTRLARNELYFNAYISMDEVNERVTAVAADEITALCAGLFTGIERMAVVALGPFADKLMLSFRK